MGEGGPDDGSEVAAGLRHGFPAPVRPLQVVPGSFESERWSRDSGVLGMNGIVAVMISSKW